MNIKIMILITTFFCCSQTFAVERWGKIEKGFTYDNLRIEQKSSTKCHLSIEVKNNSKKAVSKYRFKIVALDIHKSIEWKTVVEFDSIEKGESRVISGLVNNCTENNPYNLVFTK